MVYIVPSNIIVVPGEEIMIVVDMNMSFEKSSDWYE